MSVDPVAAQVGVLGGSTTRHPLGGLHPQKVWVSGNVETRTHHTHPPCSQQAPLPTPVMLGGVSPTKEGGAGLGRGSGLQLVRAPCAHPFAREKEDQEIQMQRRANTVSSRWAPPWPPPPEPGPAVRSKVPGATV